MKTLTNITIYKCDFCKKELKRKFAMIRHEERCSKNPINDRPCFHCLFLESADIEIDTGVCGYNDGDTIFRKAKAFKCSKKNQLLLSPKTKYLQHRDTLKWVYLGDKETEQFDMPMECEIKENFDLETIKLFNPNA